MKEDFLHYVWNFQTFEKRGLRTEDGQEVEVYHPGYAHTHDGPDFLQAKVIVGEMAWAGHVEVHIKASDWKKHGHHHDPLYNNVVLHVVWEADAPAVREDGTLPPVIALKGRVSPLLWERYARTVGRGTVLPCEGLEVEPAVRADALDQALASRIWKKSSQVTAWWHELDKDWEAVAYKMLFRAFGFQINAEAFEQLCQLVPFSLWKSLSQYPEKQEALMLGQAGFLHGEVAGDVRLLSLKAHYEQMKGLPTVIGFSFKKKGVRPGNAPLRRTTELLAWLQRHPLLMPPLEQVVSAMETDDKGYMMLHLNEDVAQHLLINVALPIAWAKSWMTGNARVPWESLLKLPAEDNKITRLMGSHGFDIPSAGQGQAVLELYNDWCQHKRCMNCAVGKRLMREK